MRIAVVFGTRPEIIKLAPLVAELERRGHPVLKYFTGQQRDLAPGTMLDMGWVCDSASFQGMSHYHDWHARVMDWWPTFLESWTPDLVLVQGDTDSALLGGLVAWRAGYPVGHVEAGLRTYERLPFPEEGNRQMLGRIASLHFCPTVGNERNLLGERAPGRRWVTGNTGIDALAAQDLCATQGDTIIVTAHRRENVAEMGKILAAVVRLARDYPRYRWLWPMHPNPDIRGVLEGCRPPENLNLVEPLAYPDMCRALAECYMVLTDSGGLLEEACHYGKPTLVLRSVTERVEAVDCGAAKLVGTDPGRIIQATRWVLDSVERHKSMTTAGCPFGDGHASERIADAIEEWERH